MKSSIYSIRLPPIPKIYLAAVQKFFFLSISHSRYKIMKNSSLKLKNINHPPFITAFLIGIRLSSSNSNFELVYCRVKFKWRSNFRVSCNWNLALIECTNLTRKQTNRRKKCQVQQIHWLNWIWRFAIGVWRESQRNSMHLVKQCFDFPFANVKLYQNGCCKY